MKLYTLAAAALLLAGGSALAYAPETGKTDLKEIAGQGAELAAFKAEDNAAKAIEAAFVPDAKPLVIPAAAVTWEKAQPTLAAGDPDLDLAETSIDDSVPAEPVISDPADTQPAVGGPFEEVASAELAPRAASQNYPACRPGPGDDNCIQLYEPGVQTALASWTAPTGGLSDGTQVAMGGPEEPVADEVDSAEAERLAMNGDGLVDEAMGETQDVEEV
ncbi:MAG TPA: hypothetical protein VLK25_00020 [Allosphingosinicella sp.]|nr:hypothetical protein [Allosphingosinicella sp.]